MSDWVAGLIQNKIRTFLSPGRNSGDFWREAVEIWTRDMNYQIAFFVKLLRQLHLEYVGKIKTIEHGSASVM